jgi:hypothetical protein
MLFSCKEEKEKKNGNYFSETTFSLDTVIIDPGDDILFLRFYLGNADIGPDSKYLFNFNEHDHTVEKINLDELRLEAKLPFEKEGPNGTSGGVMKVQNENQITLRGMSQIALFSLNGKKLKTVYFDNFSLDGAQMQVGGYIRAASVLDTVANRLYGIVNNYDDNSYDLAILDLEEFKISRLELKSFEKMPGFDIVYNSNGIVINYKEAVHIKQFDTKVILSNEVTNTLMWYDSEVDSLFIKSYNSQLTANQKEKVYIKEHETIEELEAEQRRLKQEINFMAPNWDERSQVFFRFSYEELPTSPTVEGIKAKVYLTVMDPNLNQIGEVQVPQLTKRPGKHFVKDGKIWIYENIDDEMAFVRLTMEGSN